MRHSALGALVRACSVLNAIWNTYFITSQTVEPLSNLTLQTSVLIVIVLHTSSHALARAGRAVPVVTLRASGAFVLIQSICGAVLLSIQGT